MATVLEGPWPVWISVSGGRVKMFLRMWSICCLACLGLLVPPTEPEKSASPVKTAWAAMILQEIYGPADPDLKRAIDWLAATQLTAADAAAVYAEAESLCDQFTGTTGVRTLDLLHVAFGRILGRTEFLSFDRRQRSLAALAGLTPRP